MGVSGAGFAISSCSCVTSSENDTNGGHISPGSLNLYLHISTHVGNSRRGAGIISVLDSDSCQTLIVKYLDR